MIQFLFVFSDWGILALRFFLGAILMKHGWPKISRLRETAVSFTGMGFKPALFWATIVAIVEFIGGLALVGGLFTQIFAGLIFIQFLVIILKLKRKTGFGSWEFDGLIAAAALILLVLGSGRFSLETFWNLIVF
ncbi:MAG: DoxX family protein [bacterium]|nr:DoxX family protein [bacterium]